MSAIRINEVCEDHPGPIFEKGRVVIFAAGTGNPSSPPTPSLRCG